MKPERPDVWKRGEGKPTRPDLEPPTEDQPKPQRGGGGGYWGGHGGGPDQSTDETGYGDRHGD